MKIEIKFVANLVTCSIPIKEMRVTPHVLKVLPTNDFSLIGWQTFELNKIKWYTVRP